MEESEARINDYLEGEVRKDDESKDGDEKKESQGESDKKKSAQDDVASPAGLSSSWGCGRRSLSRKGDRRRWDSFPKGWPS